MEFVQPSSICSISWYPDYLPLDSGIRCIVTGSDDDLTVICRDLLKDLAEASHPEGVSVHQPVVDDDEVTFVSAQENAYREAQEDDDLFMGPVTQAFQG